MLFLRFEDASELVEAASPSLVVSVAGFFAVEVLVDEGEFGAPFDVLEGDGDEGLLAAA